MGTFLLHPKAEGAIQIELRGDWTIASGAPTPEGLEPALQQAAEAAPKVHLDGEKLEAWGSPLISFALSCHEICQSANARLEVDALPKNARRLLQIATAVPANTEAHREEPRRSLLYCVGRDAIQFATSAVQLLSFVGDCALASVRLLLGRARFRWRDALLVMQETGAEALPITALISLLTGLILGFVGAINLESFGAAILVADLVALGMARELGCIMTGVIVAGRTGAAFAAQLGAMKVNEEIDSLVTFGFSPIEFLALPRMLALMLMMPFLCVFADFFGILGGLIVTVLTLDVTVIEYLTQSMNAISFTDFMTGVVKGACFGVLIALTGCLKGIQCRASTAAVGEAATSAVVTAITAIVVADAIFAVIFHLLEI